MGTLQPREAIVEVVARDAETVFAVEAIVEAAGDGVRRRGSARAQASIVEADRGGGIHLPSVVDGGPVPAVPPDRIACEQVQRTWIKIDSRVSVVAALISYVCSDVAVNAGC